MSGEHSPVEGDPTEGERADELAVLRAENRRLRERLEGTRDRSDRLAVAGFLAVAAVAAAGAAALPDVRTVLLAIAGTGAVGAVLAATLTREAFLAAPVAEDLFGSYAGLGGALVADLGLSSTRTYVPTGKTPASVRLYVPADPDADLPSDALDEGLLVATDDARGIALTPVGSHLVAGLRRDLRDPLGDDPATLADQLADALVSGLELADAVETEVDADGGRLDAAVAGPALGDLDGFDHPVVSVLAAGLAVGLEEPVTAEVLTGEDAEPVVRCMWTAPAEG